MKYILASILALGVATAACKSDEDRYEQDSSRVTLSVTGMHSEDHCPGRVESALESVSGVMEANVDFDRRTATVECRGECNVDAMEKALQEAGYDCSVR